LDLISRPPNRVRSTSSAWTTMPAHNSNSSNLQRRTRALLSICSDWVVERKLFPKGRG
jgi:hypothetical protein